MLYAIFAAEGPNGRHIPADVLEVYWGSAAFFVLVAAFLWKGLGPMKAALQGRTDRIKAELADAEAERLAAEEALTAKAADLPDVSEEEARIRTEAQETAARLKSDLASKADRDAEALVTRAKADAANMREQALADLREEVARLSRDAATSVVNESLDDATQTSLIDDYIRQVASS